jgi:hypothetical protein
MEKGRLIPAEPGASLITVERGGDNEAMLIGWLASYGETSPVPVVDWGEVPTDAAQRRYVVRADGSVWALDEPERWPDRASFEASGSLVWGRASSPASALVDPHARTSR